MRTTSILILAVAILLEACGSPPDFDREMLAKEPAAPSPTLRTAASSPLRVTVMRVGQGDSILIETPDGESMLVDAGPPGAGREFVLPYLLERGIVGLSQVVITHAHLDHFGGLAEILAGADGVGGNDDDIAVEGYIYDNGQFFEEDDGSLQPWYQEALASHRATVDPGQRLDIGDCDIEVVATDARLADGTLIDIGDPPDENARSIVLLLRYGEFSMLLAADATGGGGKPPYETPDVETSLSGLVGDIDVLKVAHHGSTTSSNATFLDVASPEAAIISVGDGNDHFHPHASVIERLIEAGAAVYQTERGWSSDEGVIVADGHVSVEVEEDGEYRILLE